MKLEIKINGEPAEPLSVICHRDNAYRTGRQLTAKLKELIPRQMFRCARGAQAGRGMCNGAVEGTQKPTEQQILAIGRGLQQCTRAPMPSWVCHGNNTESGRYLAGGPVKAGSWGPGTERGCCVAGKCSCATIPPYEIVNHPTWLC